MKSKVSNIIDFIIPIPKIMPNSIIRDSVIPGMNNEHKYAEDERNDRIKLLELIEMIWMPLWDLRFGQLIVNILDYGNSANYYSKNKMMLITTEDWICLIKQYNSINSRKIGEYDGFDERKDPKRIPKIMKIIKSEWLDNRLSFSQYLFERLERERPGGHLYGYEIQDY